MTFSVVKSWSESEDDILNSIIVLHNKGRPFDLDPCFSLGAFYKRTVPPPSIRFDKEAFDNLTARANVTRLPLKDGSVHSVIFDPPFMFNPHGKQRSYASVSRENRFTAFPTWQDLEETYKKALHEFQRVLVPSGIVAFKCQDYTDAKTTMTHCLVYQWATERGFYAKDIFVRVRRNGPA